MGVSPTAIVNCKRWDFVPPYLTASAKQWHTYTAGGGYATFQNALVTPGIAQG